MLNRKNFTKIIVNCLKIANVIALFTLIYVKYHVYKLKENINKIDNQIELIKGEQRNLEIEWDYLTNPERLMKIYNNLNKKQKLDMQYTQINQETTLDNFNKTFNKKRK